MYVKNKLYFKPITLGLEITLHEIIAHIPMVSNRLYDIFVAMHFSQMSARYVTSYSLFPFIASVSR